MRINEKLEKDKHLVTVDEAKYSFAARAEVFLGKPTYGQFCLLLSLIQEQEARKWCIENIFDTTEEIEDVALQNSEECARGAQEYDQGGIHARL